MYTTRGLSLDQSPTIFNILSLCLKNFPALYTVHPEGLGGDRGRQSDFLKDTKQSSDSNQLRENCRNMPCSEVSGATAPTSLSFYLGIAFTCTCNHFLLAQTHTRTATQRRGLFLQLAFYIYCICISTWATAKTFLLLYSFTLLPLTRSRAHERCFECEVSAPACGIWCSTQGVIVSTTIIYLC